MRVAHELAVERRIAAPPAHVRRVWEARLAEWFCPRPWRVEIDAVELRPGGRFDLHMLGPAGEVSPNRGVVLEAGERRIVVTDALVDDWVPNGPFMLGIWTFADDAAGGTLARGIARHWTEQDRARHEAMGFAAGWSAVLAQLATLAEGGSLD